MRPRGFEESEIVKRLEGAFHRFGFEGLSLERMTERTGLSRSSLYNAFGSKSGMMRVAVDAYAARTCERFDQTLSSRPLRAGLTRLMQVAAGRVSPEGEEERRLGCLIGNLIAERATDPKDHRYLGQKLSDLEAALVAALEQAKDEGALRAEADPARIARFVLVQMQGLRLVAKAYAEPERLDDAIAMAMTALDGDLTDAAG